MLDSQLIQILFFVGFVVVILALLFFDLGVLEKKDKVVSLKRAVVTTLICRNPSKEHYRKVFKREKGRGHRDLRRFRLPYGGTRT